MQDIDEQDSRWVRRDAKKKSKKDFHSDNRRSVRLLYRKAGEKARDIQRDKDKKEKE